MIIANISNEYKTSTARYNAINFIIIAITAFSPIYLHIASPFIGIPSALLLAILLTHLRPDLAAITLLCAWALQNLVVSLLSPFIADYQNFNIIRSYNFLLTAVVWLVSLISYVQKWRYFSPPVCALMTGVLVCLGLITPYFAYGLISNPTAAIIYLRNILTPLMLFQIFLLTAQHSSTHFHKQISILAWGVLALAFLEAFDRDLWLWLTNGYSYWELNSQPLRESGFFIKKMQQTGEVLTELKDGFRINLFNSEALSGLGITLYRLMGTNMHAISFGYALAFFLCIMLLQRQRLYALVCLPLLLLVSAKGALITLFLLGTSIIILRVFSPLSPQDPRASLSAMAIGLLIFSYSFTATAFGLYTGDYHAIGLMSGLQGFIDNPIGHGLGSGGNLAGNFAQVDWAEAQKTGSIAGAAESGIGVLLYQMGIAGCAIIAFYAFVSRLCWRYYLDNLGGGFLYPALAIPIILANALLQEEALFAPLGLGFVLAYAGHLIGQTHRKA